MPDDCWQAKALAAREKDSLPTLDIGLWRDALLDEALDPHAGWKRKEGGILLSPFVRG